MTTKKYWKKQYDSIINAHHKYNTKGYSYREFSEFTDEDKKGLLNYYITQSLLSSIEDDEMFKLDLHITPCPDAELCNFLKTEKEEELTSCIVKESLDKVLIKLRELKKLTEDIPQLEKESWYLKSIYMDLLEKEDKVIEKKLWKNKTKTFKNNMLCQ